VALTIAAKSPGELAFQTASGLKLYAEPGAFPRAWIVNRVWGVKNALEARSGLERPPEEFRRSAFVTGDPPAVGSCGEGGVASQVQRSGRHVAVRAALACPGLVVIGQTFYPGWHAFVDGKPAKLYETDGFLDGVPAPSGPHRIELIYQPWAVWVGAAISLLSAVLLTLVYKRRNVRNPVADSGAGGLT
jgi:hypothetical protein